MVPDFYRLLSAYATQDRTIAATFLFAVALLAGYQLLRNRRILRHVYLALLISLYVVALIFVVSVKAML